MDLVSSRLCVLALAALLPLAVAANGEPDDDPYDDPYDDLEPPPLVVPAPAEDPEPSVLIEPQLLPEPAASAVTETAPPDAVRVDPRELAPPTPVVSDGVRRAWQVAGGLGGSMALTITSTLFSELFIVRGLGSEGLATTLVLSSYVGGAALGVHLVGRALTREQNVPWGPTLRGASLGGLVGVTAGFALVMFPVVSCITSNAGCDALFVAIPLAGLVSFLGPVLGALYGFEQGLATVHRRRERR